MKRGHDMFGKEKKHTLRTKVITVIHSEIVGFNKKGLAITKPRKRMYTFYGSSFKDLRLKIIAFKIDNYLKYDTRLNANTEFKRDVRCLGKKSNVKVMFSYDFQDRYNAINYLLSKYNISDNQSIEKKDIKNKIIKEINFESQGNVDLDLLQIVRIVYKCFDFDKHKTKGFLMSKDGGYTPREITHAFNKLSKEVTI